MRPQSLDELIGQETIKNKLRIAMGAALQRSEPLGHVLLTSSGGGLGKSTIANIISNEMLSLLHVTTGQCICSTTDLKNILVRLEPNHMLLIDEAHCLGRAAAEEFLLVTEQIILNVTVGGQGPMQLDLSPSTLIMASTKPEAFSGPLVQRIPLHLHLDYYSASELEQIVEGMTQRMGFEFDQQVHGEIAKRGKGIPRIALRLPAPKRTAVKSMPFYDYELLVQIFEILRTGVGLNAEEISFYRRREKTPKKRKNRAKGSNHKSADSFVQQVIEGCKELGVGKDKLDVEAVKQIVAAEFNGEQPELKGAIPVVARRLLRDDG